MVIDTISERMDVRHEREIRSVATFEEKRHAGDEAEHGALVVRVDEPDGDEEGTGDDTVRVDEHFLAPDAGVRVDEVGNDAAERAEEDVQEAEHGGPPTGAGLAEFGEVLDVIGAEDGVDGQLAAEGVEVAAGQDEGLQGEDDAHRFAEGRFDDDFAARRVEHLLLADLGFVVGDDVSLVGGGELEFFVVAAGGGAFGA